MTKTAIAIGSNIEDPIVHVKESVLQLAKLGDLLAQSSLYRTKPWGLLDQPDFINAVVLIDYAGSARQLLEQVLALELSMGRNRENAVRWGPRVIDLDILTFGDLRIDEPGLTIPHRHLFERAFVLVPLAEIDISFAKALAKLPADARSEVVRLENPKLQRQLQTWSDLLSRSIAWHCRR